MNEKTNLQVTVPEVLAIELKKMPVLSSALEKRINEINAKRPVPFANAVRYVIDLIEKDVNAAAPKPLDDWSKPLSEWTTTTQKK